MRQSAGSELGGDRIPEEAVILKFRHLLERRGVTEAIFADANAHRADKGITLRFGTLVNATKIDAPNSTTNKSRARDPGTLSTKKGNDWYFRIKAHIKVDVDSGTIDSLDALRIACGHTSIMASWSWTTPRPNVARAPSPSGEKAVAATRSIGRVPPPRNGAIA